YAEAAQEKLEVYLDRLADDGNGEILVENVGGIGVAVKYVVELDWSGKTAKMCEIGETVPVNSSLVIKLSQCPDTISPDGDLYILTERGNMFKAIRGGISFELEVSPAAATIESGGELPVSLKLKAIILETPSNGTILVVADTSGCKMQATKEIISGETVTTMTIVTSISVVRWPLGVWDVIPYYGTLTAVISPTTATMTVEQEFIEKPSPMTFTFTTRTTKTINTTITLTAKNVEPWIGGSQCYIWFRILNATGGSRLAEAGLQVVAGGSTTTTTTAAPYVEINVIEDVVSGEKNSEQTVHIQVISRNGYSGNVDLDYEESDNVIKAEGGGLGFSQDPVTLSADQTVTVTFSFKIKNSGTVTIVGTASPSAEVQPDFFTVIKT
ncbi:MAG: hypothetical protein J7L79_03485, partial [Thaumarchaeota archaeon]|nr:hypothetical protein [Nitrososphaerota archaeon]